MPTARIVPAVKQLFKRSPDLAAPAKEIAETVGFPSAARRLKRTLDDAHGWEDLPIGAVKLTDMKGHLSIYYREGSVAGHLRALLWPALHGGTIYGTRPAESTRDRLETNARSLLLSAQAGDWAEVIRQAFVYNYVDATHIDRPERISVVMAMFDQIPELKDSAREYVVKGQLEQDLTDHFQGAADQAISEVKFAIRSCSL